MTCGWTQLLDAIHALRADLCAKIRASDSMKAIKVGYEAERAAVEPRPSRPYFRFLTQIKEKHESLPQPFGFVVFLGRQLWDTNLEGSCLALSCCLRRPRARVFHAARC